MTSAQLQQIVKFVKPMYLKTGTYHAWDHIEMVRLWAVTLAKKFPSANIAVLEAACYIHDIGRTVKDEGHPRISAELVKPFLEKIGIPTNEIEVTLEAVSHHDKAEIRKANSIEAKLLFDADKLQIVSVFGFMRCWAWLMEERKMAYDKSLQFLLDYSRDTVDNFMQTPEARKVAKKEFAKVEKLGQDFFSWQKNQSLSK